MHVRTIGGGGSGGGALTFNQYAIFFEKLGPTSYTTGGFVIDLTSTFSSLNWLRLGVKKGLRGSLPWGSVRVKLNTPTPGKATIILEKDQFTKTTAIGNVASQPSGVTVQTSGNQTSTSEGAHTHTTDHNHPSTNSAANAGGVAGVDTDALAPSIAGHVHRVDIGVFTGTSAAPTATHNHTDNTLYAHSHSVTYTTTDVTTTEVANGTNLSTTQWDGLALGVRA